MERTGKNYRRCTPLYEISLPKQASYSEVISILSSELPNLDSQQDCLKLVTAGGSIISNTDMAPGIPWTVGAYLQKRHIAANKLKLGITATCDASGNVSVTWPKAG